MSTTTRSTPGVETVCVIGSAGQLGHDLLRLGGDPNTGLTVRGADMPEVDITRPDSIAALLERHRPQVVINAAAYTDVDGCESHEDLAFAVNAVGPGNLAEACRDRGCRLIHVSTDYVFDGSDIGRPWRPDNAIAPQSVYGRTKAEGERQVRQHLDDHAIVRTSWLFGTAGKNFVKTILRAACERPELRVVDDQVGCPTYAADLAGVLLTLAQGAWRGTYHFCNAGACSWNGFAREIVRLAGLTTPVLPMTTAELNRPAPRPAYSVLDTTTLTRDTGIVPRPWGEALAECVESLAERAVSQQ